MYVYIYIYEYRCAYIYQRICVRVYIYVYTLFYRVIPAFRNWQIETTVLNLASFLHYAVETRWQ